MNLGLKRNEVRIVDYTPEWAEEFNRVKNEIMKFTNIGEERIEHIGSTAIIGMSAKPIIDIVVGIDDLNKADKTLFTAFQQEANFLRLKVKKSNEIVLAKFTDDTYEVKTHFIHLVEYKNELWNNLIFFRDYLNSNEAARKKYLEIKLEYLKQNSTGINEYTEFKEQFVKGIFKKDNKNIKLE